MRGFRVFINPAYPVLVGISIWYYLRTIENIPKPYMDEIFHVPQTQLYCEHDFFNWDPKITTPPGLYVIGYIYSEFVRNFIDPVLHVLDITAPEFCSITTLRSVNLIAGLLVIPSTIAQIVNDPLSAVILSGFPLSYFYNVLFYTDVWSTAFVLLALKSGLERPHSVLPVVFSAASLLFRQTNIIWAAFVAIVILDRVRVSSNAGGRTSSWTQDLVSFVSCTLRSFTISGPFLLLAAGFVAFVKINGGISLGDKANHEISVNIPQLLYCSLFINLFSAPLWVSLTRADKYFKFVLSSYRGMICYFLSLGLLGTIITFGTISHPFLLADNRHYTFYLWRRFIEPTWTLGLPEWAPRLLMVPVYHFSIWNIAYTFQSACQQSWILSFAFIGSSSAVLIPSPLLEPRYYIISYLIYRTIIWPKHSTRRLLLEGFWYICINISTAYVFIYHPFEWESEPGIKQRFMW